MPQRRFPGGDRYITGLTAKLPHLAREPKPAGEFLFLTFCIMPTKASTSSAHTPGPWFADLIELVIYTDDQQTVAAVPEQAEPSNDSDVTSATCHLIAAAPELLEKLTALASAAHWVANHWESGELAEAVNALADIAYWADRTIAVAHGTPLPCSECGGIVTDPTDEFCEPCNQRATL